MFPISDTRLCSLGMDDLEGGFSFQGRPQRRRLSFQNPTAFSQETERSNIFSQYAFEARDPLTSAYARPGNTQVQRNDYRELAYDGANASLDDYGLSIPSLHLVCLPLIYHRSCSTRRTLPRSPLASQPWDQSSVSATKTNGSSARGWFLWIAVSQRILAIIIQWGLPRLSSGPRKS